MRELSPLCRIVPRRDSAFRENPLLCQLNREDIVFVFLIETASISFQYLPSRPKPLAYIYPEAVGWPGRGSRQGGFHVQLLLQLSKLCATSPSRTLRLWLHV